MFVVCCCLLCVGASVLYLLVFVVLPFIVFVVCGLFLVVVCSSVIVLLFVGGVFFFECGFGMFFVAFALACCVYVLCVHVFVAAGL